MLDGTNWHGGFFLTMGDMMKILDTLTNRTLHFMTNALVGVSIMVMLLNAAPATAQSASQANRYAQTGEAVYLVDSCRDCTTSVISRVFFDDVTEEASLVKLAEVDYKAVYNMGLTPDGKMLPLLQSGDGAIGVFNVETGEFTDNGFLKLLDGSSVTGVALGAYPPSAAPPYFAIIGSEFTNLIYSANPFTEEATSLGHIYVPAAGSTADDYLHLKGADLAFTANGHMYLWTNLRKEGSEGLMAEGLYRVDWNTSANRYEGIRIEDGGIAETTFVTGLALRSNGRAGPGGEFRLVGSVNNANWMQLLSVKADSDVMQDSAEYPYSTDHVHIFGDMASAVGPIGMLPCTYTIGYWKNHPWEYSEGSGFPGSVQLCGETIGESDGKQILRSAKNSNFSMLTAQLIAAKLNAGASAAGTPIMDVIRDAEAFLCEQVDPEGKRGWSQTFDRTVRGGFTQKQWATDYKDDLVYFNEGRIEGLAHCD